MNSNRTELEEGWNQITPEIENLIHKVWHDNDKDPKSVSFSNEEYMKVYLIVYNMCTQKPPYNYSEQLYQKYIQIIEQTFVINIIPRLDKSSEKELSTVIQSQWLCFSVFVKWMSSFFSYLDRFHTKRQGLPRLKDTGNAVFKDYLKQRYSEDILSLLEDK